MKILYFSWLREKVGAGEEDVSLPDDVDTVGALVTWLRARGAGYDAAFADAAQVRVAVNLEHVDLEHPVADGDEVAFFPPVTGG